ncbi:MAG: helix-turn-helix transcriptional regulator [Candidatus Binataceae bacterium]
MSEHDSILNTGEAAEFLHVPRRTLEGWRYRGEGPPYVRVNHACIRYRLRDLVTFLAAKTVTPRNDRQTAA